MTAEPAKPLNDASVTRWLRELRSGDDAAASRLWEFLRKRLLVVSRNAIERGRPQSTYDEDDVAQSAYYSLCSAIQAGRYEELEDRDQLWKLLTVIAVNKVKNRVRNGARIRRGGQDNHVANGDPHLQNLISSNLPVDDDVMMQEECERLLSLLQQDELKQVAVLKVEGYTNVEIADHLMCSRRSVQRRLNLIRDVWASEIQ